LAADGYVRDVDAAAEGDEVFACWGDGDGLALAVEIGVAASEVLAGWGA
jgi:hypothetical protein